MFCSLNACHIIQFWQTIKSKILNNIGSQFEVHDYCLAQTLLKQHDINIITLISYYNVKNLQFTWWDRTEMMIFLEQLVNTHSVRHSPPIHVFTIHLKSGFILMVKLAHWTNIKSIFSKQRPTKWDTKHRDSFCQNVYIASSIARFSRWNK